MSPRRLVWLGGLAALLAPTEASALGRLVIDNVDEPSIGFNDTTPATPVGGNPGTTLGEQRLFAIQYAAAKWHRTIVPRANVVVRASFAPLACDANGAVLGSAGAAEVQANFANAPTQDTWYHAALANQIAGADLNGDAPEIEMRFSSKVDASACLGDSGWYYGFDGDHGSDIDLVAVALHELAHGLGFSNFINEQTGVGPGFPFYPFPDAYTEHTFDHQLGKTWAAMTPLERVQSATHDGDVAWDGRHVRRALFDLEAGLHESGHVLLFAPATLKPGSSISHWDTEASPNLLMEPYITSGVGHDVGPAAALLRDMGWAPARCGDGIVDSDEACDDGNTIPDDGCNASCTTEFCGDGVVQGGEQCDDGGANSNAIPDACREDCMPAYCGDGVVDAAEECDDGNARSGDGCDADCHREPTTGAGGTGGAGSGGAGGGGHDDCPGGDGGEGGATTGSGTGTDTHPGEPGDVGGMGGSGGARGNVGGDGSGGERGDDPEDPRWPFACSASPGSTHGSPWALSLLALVAGFGWRRRLMRTH